MPVQFVVVPFEFNQKQFQRDIEQQRKRCRLSYDDLGAFVGRSHSWAQVLVKGSGIETVTVADFLKLCNTFDLNPSDYFQLSE